MKKRQSVMNIASKYGEYSCNGDEIVFAWPDTVSISMEDLWKEIDADWLVWESLEYSRTRATAYPSLTDQADMQFHDSVNGTTTWQDAIQAIKDKYPKPE